VIRGIGLISCVYVNVKTGQLVIDYRIYDPDGDGKTKLDHVADMLRNWCTASNFCQSPDG